MAIEQEYLKSCLERDLQRCEIISYSDADLLAVVEEYVPQVYHKSHYDDFRRKVKKATNNCSDRWNVESTEIDKMHGQYIAKIEISDEKV